MTKKNVWGLRSYMDHLVRLDNGLQPIARLTKGVFCKGLKPLGWLADIALQPSIWGLILTLVLCVPSLTHAQEPTNPPANPETATILIAIHDLPRGHQITALDIFGEEPVLAWQTWAWERAPILAIEDARQAYGAYLRNDVPAGSPILLSQLAPVAEAVSTVGSDIALLTPAERVTLPLLINDSLSLPDNLAVNDCVSVEGYISAALVLEQNAQQLSLAGATPQEAMRLILVQGHNIPLTLSILTAEECNIQ